MEAGCFPKTPWCNPPIEFEELEASMNRRLLESELQFLAPSCAAGGQGNRVGGEGIKHAAGGQGPGDPQESSGRGLIPSSNNEASGPVHPLDFRVRPCNRRGAARIRVRSPADAPRAASGFFFNECFRTSFGAWLLSSGVDGGGRSLPIGRSLNNHRRQAPCLKPVSYNGYTALVAGLVDERALRGNVRPLVLCFAPAAAARTGIRISRAEPATTLSKLLGLRALSGTLAGGFRKRHPRPDGGFLG